VDVGGIALRPGGASVGVNAAQSKSAGRTGPKVPGFTAAARRPGSPVGAFFPIGRAATPTNRGRAAERIHIHQGSVVAKLARHESERTPFSRMLASVISAAG